jgi:hypothetical protein
MKTRSFTALLKVAMDDDPDGLCAIMRELITASLGSMNGQNNDAPCGRCVQSKQGGYSLSSH